MDTEEPEIEVPDLTGLKLADIVVNPRLEAAHERVAKELQDEDKYTAFGNTP